MPDSSLLTRAANLVCEHRCASAALLQRKLSIGHGEAMRLLAQLASRGHVEAPNPDGLYRYAGQMKVALRGEPHERHARALRDLALYLLDCGPRRDTRCVDLILHPLECPIRFIDEIARSASVSAANPVQKLARALSTLPSLAPPAPAVARFAEALDEFCAEVAPGEAAAPRPAADELHACLNRAMRYLDKRLHDGWGPHSRCLEYFVPDELLPQGQGLEGDCVRREHVVPCVMLCAEATRMLEHGILPEDVAQWIEPYLRIVLLDAQAVHRLDVELRLKTTMPNDWTFGSGCIYARMHAADILFEPPAAGPECCGWTIDRHL